MPFPMRTQILLLIAIALAPPIFAADKAAEKGDASLRERESECYRMITLPTPEGVQFEAGEMQFIAPNKLVCSTRIGEIWIGEGVLGDAPKPKWTLFASGLHEVLGITYKDGWLYATQRCEVTRLKDTKGTGRADVIETYSDGWAIEGDYHEYAFGSKFDKDGNMFVVLCLTGSFHSTNPFRGWCMKIVPGGQAVPYCYGIRSPGGVGYNAAGDLFYCDNQGVWNGPCALKQLKFGAFDGNPDSYKWFDDPATKDMIAAAGLKKPAVEPTSGGRLYEEAKRIPELLPPAINFPYKKMGQSASGIAFDPSAGKFGPFKEQVFVGDQTHSTVMRCFMEKEGGMYQGACFPFREGFDSGNLGLELTPEGSLFVFGTDRGWGARGGKQFALQRLVWTGKTPFEIREMRAKHDGFELAFTEPVDAQSAGNPASYTIETYTWIYQSSYGSPEVDQTTPTIKSIQVAPDKMSARLVIDGLVEGHLHEMHFPGVKSAKGEPLLHDAAYYTLNKIPAR
jgi:glucose/arabinose dehydrogenase